MIATSPSSRIGQLIGGRYRIESVLGEGGMGVLFVAEHQYTQRKVALKLLHPSREDLPELRARFLGEARAAAATRHPHVVDVLDMGMADDGAPFLVMELLEGVSLDKRIALKGRLSPAETLSYILPLAGALAVLHDAGIVHRDIKPSNIFLTADARGGLRPKLLDFGLARAVSDLRLTRSGMVLGTPMYMAPEQAAGGEVTLQSDVWSLGVVLYECLAGEPPFTSRDSQAIAAQVLAGQTRPLRKTCPEIPAPLAEAVERALRGSRELRYHDMRAMAASLVSAAMASGIALPEDPDPQGLPEYRAWRENPAALATTVETALPVQPPAEAEPAQPSQPGEAVAARPLPQPAQRARPPLALALALLATLGAALAWWVVQPDDAPAAARPAQQPAPRSTPAAAAPTPPPAAAAPAAPVIAAPPLPPPVAPDSNPPAPTRARPSRVKPRPAGALPRALPQSKGGVQLESEWK